MNIDNFIEVKILSKSMVPALTPGEKVTIKSAIYNRPQVGSIILFLHHPDHATIHRITAIIEQDGKTYYRTKGDANPQKDYYLVDESEVIGVMIEERSS